MEEEPVKVIPKGAGKIPCRFNIRCFNTNCYWHHDTPFCINKLYCKDFYCRNRHIKDRIRPCGAGGDCTKKNCEYLHPIPCEKIEYISNMLDVPTLQHIAKERKCSFEWFPQKCELKVSSNRGEVAVNNFISDAKKQNLAISYDRNNCSCMKQVVDTVGIVELPKFCDMFNNTLKKIYEGTVACMYQRLMIVQNSNKEKMPTASQIMDLFNTVNVCSFEYRDEPNNKVYGRFAIEAVENQFFGRYFAVSDQAKKIITFYSFEPLDSIEAQQLLFKLKDLCMANVLICSSYQLSYLRDYSDEIKRLLNLGCIKFDSENYSIIIKKAFISIFNRIEVYPIVQQELDRATQITYENVEDPSGFHDYLIRKYSKIVVGCKDNNCTIVTDCGLFQHVIGHIDRDRLCDWKFSKIKINGIYGTYLRETGKFPPGLPEDKYLFSVNCVVVCMRRNSDAYITTSHMQEILRESEKTVISFTSSWVSHADITKNEYKLHERTIKKLARIYGVHVTREEVSKQKEICGSIYMQKVMSIVAWGIRDSHKKFINDILLLTNPDTPSNLQPYTEVKKTWPYMQWNINKTRIREKVMEKKANISCEHTWVKGSECVIITISGLRITEDIFNS